MRYLVSLLAAAVLLVGAVSAQANVHDLNVAHRTLGSACTHSHPGPLGYRAICRHGRVVRLATDDGATTITERVDSYTLRRPGTQHKVRVGSSTLTTAKQASARTETGPLLIVRSELRKGQPTLHTSAVPPANCTDTRGRLLAGTIGLPFHTYWYRVNTGQAQTMTWASGNVFLSGAGERLIFEATAAFQDWQGHRNPSEGNASGRYPGFYAGCQNDWPQQASPPNDPPTANYGRVSNGYQGTTTLSPSMQPTCEGGTNTGTDGVSVTTAANWTCGSGLYAVTFTALNSQGYIVENDMSLNNRAYGTQTTWCYRFTNGCISTAWLASSQGVFTIPAEDILRHEIGHALGLTHTCGSQNCSFNTMDVDYVPSQEWPRDIGNGDRLNEVLLYTAH